MLLYHHESEENLAEICQISFEERKGFLKRERELNPIRLNHMGGPINLKWDCRHGKGLLA